MSNLNQKLSDRQKLTRRWALGVDIDFPEYPAEKEKPVIADYRGELSEDEIERIKNNNPNCLFQNDNPHSKKG